MNGNYIIDKRTMELLISLFFMALLFAFIMGWAYRGIQMGL